MSSLLSTSLGLNQPGSSAQWMRKMSLLVSNSKGQAIEFDQFRVKFNIKTSSTQTPNAGDIYIYNLSYDTYLLLKSEYTTVILSAGYQGGTYGVIHKGNIKQVIYGRESATDTFVNIISGDADLAYNFATVNTTLAAGSTYSDHINVCTKSMGSLGVVTGTIGTENPQPLPRAKVMYGMARDHLRQIADSTDSSWNIQNGTLNFIKSSTAFGGTPVVLTSKTGMIGTPQQTNEGVNVKCLLNPYLRSGGRIQIDNRSVAQFKINLLVANSPSDIPPPTNADGVYYILTSEFSGDTRGTDWYSSLVCLTYNVLSNPLNAITIGAGN